jgi:hypothetical protein
VTNQDRASEIHYIIQQLTTQYNNMSKQPNKLKISVENLEIDKVKGLLIKTEVVDPLVGILRAITGKETKVNLDMSVQYGLINLTLTATDE